MKNTVRALLVSSSLLSLGAFAQANVVTTIKPLHALVAQITQGVSEPTLLIQQGSPHGYQLKPNDVKAINEADLLVWVGKDLETFVPDVLAKSGDKLSQLAWMDIDGVEKLKTRRGGLWEEDEHEHHDHDHKHKHKHDHDHDHKHEHKHDHKHEHDEHHDHDHHGHHHGEYDAHVWLSVDNSKVLLNSVAEQLGQIDPENKEKYAQNLKQALAQLDELNHEIARIVEPVKNKPFMVFHDAYQYFEHEYGLQSIGAVRVSPEHEPGAARIGQLHQLMQQHQIECLFNEPQFPAKLAEKLVQGTEVKLATLDPIGADLVADQSAHAKLMRNLASSLRDCLN